MTAQPSPRLVRDPSQAASRLVRDPSQAASRLVRDPSQAASRLRAVALIVLDSVGIGEAPDAADFGDEGSATLQHVAEAVGGLELPNLARLGLGRIADIAGVPVDPAPTGAFGAMIELSAGKDSTTGHWEMAGVVMTRPFPTYPNGFPKGIIEAFSEAIGSPILGNVPASGTKIMERLGAEHMGTGYPIVYTSADSVFQVAAHVEVIPLERLYEMCRIARSLLVGEHEVGRVIARPFTGSPGHFERTPDRHDFSVLPPQPTVLDAIAGAGQEVRAVGKIADLFGGRGPTSFRPTRSNEEGIEAVIAELANISNGLVFANLVDFDQSFGHRNDPAGYAAALAQFDSAVPGILEAAGSDALVLMSADHGNDPTTPSTDHSRERVPLIVGGESVRAGSDLGTRQGFCDCAATVAELLGVPWRGRGTSFAGAL